MPTAKSNRAKGKHKGSRVQWTGNKFLITSAEAHLIQAQIGQLQQYIQILFSSLNERLVKLEPTVPAAEQPPDGSAGSEDAEAEPRMYVLGDDAPTSEG
jgi:hypothetical protein